MTYYDSFFGEDITNPYEALQKRKQEMRNDGYTDIQIDEMICEYSEHFGIDISLFDDEWVSDEYKEIAKIREIEDEYEQNRQLQLIAEKIVEDEEKNEYRVLQKSCTKSDPKKVFFNFIRWIFFIPASFLSGIFIFCALMLLNTVFVFDWDEAGIIARISILAVNGAVSGAVSVYVASRIVPSHKKAACVVFCIISVFLALSNIALGFLFDIYYPSMITNSCSSIGAIAVTIGIIKGEFL